MNILLTNDDGINSPGIQVLQKALSKKHNVWVVAPDGDRSGISHSITLKKPVKMIKVSEQVFACDGTPVDCILISNQGAIPVKPDIVIAGMNLGSNLGSDILFSGTAAAARQAALLGYTAIATSIDSFEPPFYFDLPTEFVEENLSAFKAIWTPSHFININFPNVKNAGYNIEITHLAHLKYTSTLTSFTAPTGEIYHFYRGTLNGIAPEDGSDWAAISRGNISISPVYLLHVLDKEEDNYSPEMFKKPAASI
ncbi:MAG: 5'/3'-nucleotidase SurE [Spirochaetota bacterium]